MTTRDLEFYQLPDGRVIPTDASATKSAPAIDFALADGTIITATRHPFPWPVPPAPAPGEPVSHYGARMLAYLIGPGEYAYGLCGDWSLDVADAAAAGMAAADLTPATRETISQTRHRIARTLKTRQDERQAADQAAQAPAAGPEPRQGPGAPLTPAPRTQPPAGQVADLHQPARPGWDF